MTKKLCFMTRLLAAVLAVVMLSSAISVSYTHLTLPTIRLV